MPERNDQHDPECALIKAPDDHDKEAPARIRMVGIAALAVIVCAVALSEKAQSRISRVMMVGFLLNVVHLLAFYVLGTMVGVTIYRFSVNLGGALLRFQVRDTWFAINWLPMSGYVKFAGMVDGGAMDTGEVSWKSLPRLVRVSIVLAGPASVLAVGVAMLGVNGSVQCAGTVFSGLSSSLFEGQARQVYSQAWRCIEASSLRELTGRIAIVMSLSNLLPLPILNGGQAIMELSGCRQSGRVAVLLQVISLFLLVAFALFSAYAFFLAW